MKNRKWTYERHLKKAGENLQCYFVNKCETIEAAFNRQLDIIRQSDFRRIARLSCDKKLSCIERGEYGKRLQALLGEMGNRF